MSQAASRKRGRTPRDDAPPYDPAEWTDSELSFIESFSRRAAEAQLRQHNEDSGALSGMDAAGRAMPAPVPANAADRENASGFHTLPLFRPQSVFSRLFHYFFPAWYRRYQGNFSGASLRDMSNEDLLALMQLALAAGERDRSGVIAQELSRRRLQIGVTTSSRHAATAAGDINDEKVPLIWVAGTAAAAAASAATGTAGAPTRSPVEPFGDVTRSREVRRKLARYEGRDGSIGDGGDAPGRRQQSRSWWADLFGGRRGRARDGEMQDGGESSASGTPQRRLRQRGGMRAAPAVAPEPPSNLLPHTTTTAAAAPPANDNDATAPRRSVGRASSGFVSPLDPGPVPPQFLSEAFDSTHAGATAGERPKGQLRPSRAVPLSGDAAPVWSAAAVSGRPPLARHSGHAATAAAATTTTTQPRGGSRGDRGPSEASASTIAPWNRSPEMAASHVPARGNNWWAVKNGASAAPPNTAAQY